MIRVPSPIDTHPNWIVWKSVRRGDNVAKLPFRPVDGRIASTTNPADWTTLDKARLALQTRAFAGLGYVFARGGGVFGIDLDECFQDLWNIEPWGLKVLDTFRSYCELSPSHRGVKIWCLGNFPDKGFVIPQGTAANGGKRPAVEVYGWGRFFAFTGERLADRVDDLVDHEETLRAFAAKCRPATRSPIDFRYDRAHRPQEEKIARGRRYLAKVPPTVTGNGGCHNRTFRAACVLIGDIGLTMQEAYTLLQEWNERCDPPWTDAELLHKVKDAAKKNPHGPGGANT